MSVEERALRGERERERATFRRRSVVLHFSFLPEENAFAAVCNPRSKHLSYDTRGLFSRDHVQLLTEHTYIDKGKSPGERRLRQGVDRPEPLVEKYFPRGYFEYHRCYKPSGPATERWGF